MSAPRQALSEAQFTKSDQCSRCNLKFGFIVNKRHHCRGCGNSFCYECSKFVIFDDQRSCEDCYMKFLLVTDTSPINHVINSHVRGIEYTYDQKMVEVSKNFQHEVERLTRELELKTNELNSIQAKNSSLKESYSLKIRAMQEELAQTLTAVKVSHEMQEHLKVENAELLAALDGEKHKSEQDLATLTVKNRTYKRQVVKLAKQVDALKLEVLRMQKDRSNMLAQSESKKRSEDEEQKKSAEEDAQKLVSAEAELAKLQLELKEEQTNNQKLVKAEAELAQLQLELKEEQKKRMKLEAEMAEKTRMHAAAIPTNNRQQQRPEPAVEVENKSEDLLCACDLEVCKQLRQGNSALAALNNAKKHAGSFRDRSHSTVLHLVVAQQDGGQETADAVASLLDGPEGAALLDAQNGEGQTALVLACAGGMFDVASLLLEGGCQINTADRNGRTALLEAVQVWNVQLIHDLLSMGAVLTHAILCWAGDFADEHKFRRRSELEAMHRELVGQYISTPDSELLRLCVEGKDTAHLQELLDSKADINARLVYDQSTPLLLAARHGHAELVAALLACGESVDRSARDERGRDARELATLHGHEHVLELLN